MRINLRHHFAPFLRPLLMATALLAAASTADASGYLRCGDIKGESTDSGHKDWIIIQSMSSPIFRSIPEGSDAPPRVEAGDFKVEVPMSKATPKLLEAAVKGKVFPKVEIHLTQSDPNGERTYFIWELSNVRVTSYSVSGSSAADSEPPMESLALNFEMIRAVHVAPEGSKEGNVETTWKVEEGES